MSTLERSLRDRVAGILGVSPSAVNPAEPLSRLGLDSLGMLQLVAGVESDTGREWSVSNTSEQLTLAALAQLFDTSQDVTHAGSATPMDLMLSDSILPPEIIPAGSPDEQANSILLTGATGFLGSYLLAVLLRTTAARIVCLVRPDRVTGEKRVAAALARYGLCGGDLDSRRIEVVHADLSQPRLGLSPSTFDALAGATDAIFHCAASLSWIQSYAVLRHPNVVAVRELLRMACRSRTKPFHFVSSLGVCYSTVGPRVIDESWDDPGDLRGIHLPYAQTKLVAEALVRAASGRGLPACIFRLPFLAGDSASGLSNNADFLSSLVKGCIQMQLAPDLDWRLDALPVNFIAESIARLALSRKAAGLSVFNVASPRPRHWRELVLWMNLYGYGIQLARYEDWLAQLRRNALDPAHPLRPLLPFFERRPLASQDMFLPQLYEEPAKRRVDSTTTLQALRSQNLEAPDLGPSLLDRYFSAYIDRGFLPAVERKPFGVRAAELDVAWFAGVLPGMNVSSAVPTKFSGENSVISELTSWRSGRAGGLSSYRLGVAGGRTLDVVIKIKASEAHVVETGATVAALCSPALGRAFCRFSNLLGVSQAGIRELAIYQRCGDRIRQYLPGLLYGHHDGAQTLLMLEKLDGMVLMNSVDSPEAWSREHIEAAIAGLADIQGAGCDREQLCLASYPSATRMAEATPLWTSLAEHAAPFFRQWVDARLPVVQQRLIASLPEWWRRTEALPHTLIHNDFTPRNLAFRSADSKLRLCVYDWELAAHGLPQHDLAELLCFVLQPPVQADEVFHYIEQHRRRLERSVGFSIDGKIWREGFRLSLFDLLLNRFSAYTMIHRFQKQAFLERVVRCWMSIYECFE